ncbi:hypothetical protein MPLB_1740028 [Mesorhizobium sp. ORS 3324]|nr:hypothetical protein MPLB_1740028 [Mesorhizobium sp. ORS 3324]
MRISEWDTSKRNSGGLDNLLFTGLSRPKFRLRDRASRVPAR